MGTARPAAGKSGCDVAAAGRRRGCARRGGALRARVAEERRGETPRDVGAAGDRAAAEARPGGERRERERFDDVEVWATLAEPEEVTLEQAAPGDCARRFASMREGRAVRQPCLQGRPARRLPHRRPVGQACAQGPREPGAQNRRKLPRAPRRSRSAAAATPASSTSPRTRLSSTTPGAPKRPDGTGSARSSPAATTVFHPRPAVATPAATDDQAALRREQARHAHPAAVPLCRWKPRRNRPVSRSAASAACTGGGASSAARRASDIRLLKNSVQRVNLRLNHSLAEEK